MAAAAVAYLADVAPDNAALNTFEPVASAWTDATTDAQMAAAAQPVIQADAVFEQALETTDWPLVAAADVRSLASSMAQIDAGLETLGSVNALNIGTWEQSFAQAWSQSGVDANEVRHDLGLPPAS